MSKTSKILMSATLACVAYGAVDAMAASQAEINASISSGLAYLDSQQTSGVWSSGSYPQAHTGAAVFAMLSQKSLWGANAATYQNDVNNGIEYLLQSASLMNGIPKGVSTRNDGVNVCPGGSGSCTGVYWYGGGESTYTTGQVAMAIAEFAKSNPNLIATTSGPLAGMTWKDIAQGIINSYAASQSSSINGNRDGGWRYYIPGNGDSDMSTTQWAVLASIYGQSLGASTPQTVTDHLKTWLANTQASDGSGCYQPGTQPCEAADTGALLLSLDFVGKTQTDLAVQSALAFINSNWTSGANNTWYGNFGQPYAMWAQYKGLELSIGLLDTSAISNLLDPTCGGNSPTTCNWWQDYNQWLVNNQTGGGGSWSGYGYWDNVLTTAYDLPILGGAEIPVNPPPTVPEPATLSLVALALVALTKAKQKQSSKAAS